MSNGVRRLLLLTELPGSGKTTFATQTSRIIAGVSYAP